VTCARRHLVRRPGAARLTGDRDPTAAPEHVAYSTSGSTGWSQNCIALTARVLSNGASNAGRRSTLPSLSSTWPRRTASARQCAPPGTTVRAEERLGSRLLDLTVGSEAVGADANVRLLTLVGWAKDGRRWPVLYPLHGCCDTYITWTRSTDVETLASLPDAVPARCGVQA